MLATRQSRHDPHKPPDQKNRQHNRSGTINCSNEKLNRTTRICPLLASHRQSSLSSWFFGTLKAEGVGVAVDKAGRGVATGAGNDSRVNDVTDVVSLR
jgi:hypothetical protein